MAGPSFDVKANVSSATQAVKQVDRAIDEASKTAERANKRQFRPLAPGAIDELREAVKLLKEMSTLSGQARPGGFIGSGGGSGPLAPTTPPRNFDSEPSSGSRRRGGRWSNYGTNSGIGRFASAFAGGVGGPTSTIANEAFAGARGSGGGFSAMGLLRGGLIGAGLFGAYKLGSAVSEGYESAKTKAVDVDTLKRAMGDLGKSFSMLQAAADYSAKGLGINSNEAAKLAIEYNKLSGGLKGPADVVSELRNSVGFGRSYGMDPGQSGQFFASMRYMSGGDEKSSRRLALLIGETISRTGMNARAAELISAIQSFASATNRVSLAAPNVSGYTGAFAGMMGLGIKGMTSDSAMSILSSANQAMMGMGAAGEAGQNFTMAAFNAGGGRLNPVQAGVLAEGGMFGTRAGAFGANSAYATYMLSQGIDVSGLASGGGTNFEAVRAHLDRLGGSADLKLDAAKRYFGLNSYNQASALMAMQPQKMGALGSLLNRNGINVGSVNETGIATLGDIATAGSRGDLMRVYSSLKGRTGKSALSADEANQLEALSGGDMEKFRDALTKIAASKSQEETDGSKTRQQMKDIETATTNVGEMLLKPMEVMRDALLVMANKGGPASIRAAAAEMEKREIDDEYKTKIKDFMNDKARGESTAAEDGKRVRELQKERDAKKAAVDARMKASADAEKKLEAISSGESDNSVSSSVGGSDLFDRVINQESRGRHLGKDGKLLRSSAGALGVSQVMPKTGVDPGYGVKPLQDNTEAEYRRFGRDYLNAMLKKYNGDENKALAAYNAGPGRVDEAIKNHGDKWLSALPGETQNYVSSIQGNHDAPLPAGAKAASGDAPIRIRLDGEFRSVDASGRQTAAPVDIRKDVSAPRSAGARL